MRGSHRIAGALSLAALAPLGCGSNGENGGNVFVVDGGSSDVTFAGTVDSNLGDVSLVTPVFGVDGGGTQDAAPINPDAQGVFAISPSGLQTITVMAGQNTPTVSFAATYSGLPVDAAWTVDRGDLGTVGTAPSPTVALAPSGSTGGLVTVTAGFNGKLASAQVFIKLTANQNGPNASDPGEQAQIATSVAQLTQGGGVGGVGGDGLGVAVTDGPTLAALGTPTGSGSAQGLTFLYPYDGTVWPRGMLAPLLMWQWTLGDADAIQVSLATTSGSFSWTGTFGRPAVLTAGQTFVRHPIPQDIWDMATNTAGGPTPSGMPDSLTVTLTVAKSVAVDGGTAAETGFGPITETWPVAPSGLPGIIYYNSYGTQLAQNSTGAVGGNGMFGAAVLSIHVGDTAPQLVAGTNGGAAQCRACHSVAAGGSRLVVQHGDNNYDTSSAYTLTPTGSVETVLANDATFSGVYPDGSLTLTEPGKILPLPSDATLPTVNGLSAFATDVGTPMFSPDGTTVAFNPMAGSGVTKPAQQIWVMAYVSTTTTFSGPTLVVDDTGKPAQTRPGWPAFFPDGKSLAFHHQSVAGVDGNTSGALWTRKGAKAQIAWTSASDSTHVTPLNELNGMNAAGTVYLPQLAQPSSLQCTADNSQVGNINPAHDDDVDLNYEPTVNPEASGGYVWIVFTSRRLYGNEATIPPFCSDPRGVDLVENITTKKLWVAAVDLGAQPGTDASHPAFYLPGQELLAGNSRGFWVLEPCHQDGQSCKSGDQCCNGYCEPEGDGGALICANTPPNNACSAVANKCITAAACCDTTNLCVNGFCTISKPPQGPQ